MGIKCSLHAKTVSLVRKKVLSREKRPIHKEERSIHRKKSILGKKNHYSRKKGLFTGEKFLHKRKGLPQQKKFYWQGKAPLRGKKKLLFAGKGQFPSQKNGSLPTIKKRLCCRSCRVPPASWNAFPHLTQISNYQPAVCAKIYDLVISAPCYYSVAILLPDHISLFVTLRIIIIIIITQNLGWCTMF